MIYYKDKNKKYTDLCKEFDEEFYKEDRDDFKLFKTMYLVYYMLASKKKYFQNVHEYDEYAYYAAKTIYLRYMKKQSNGERIKSLLNYAKKTKGFLKTMYQNDNYRSDNYRENEEDITLAMSMQDKLREWVQQDYKYDMEEQVNNIINALPTCVDKIIHQTPYRHDKVMCKNLEMSCMLTLMSQMTLSNKTKEKILKKEDKNKVIEDSKIFKYLEEERDDVICWRLSESMSDYVKLLVNKIRRALSRTIYDTKSSYELSEDVLDSVIHSAYVKDDVDTIEEY